MACEVQPPSRIVEADGVEAGAARSATALIQPDLFEMAPMRDGTRLATYILLPEGQGPFPAILTRTPYKDSLINWSRYGHERYLEAGYAVVYQSTRGTGESEGVFRFFTDDREDGYDAVEWVAAQSWSNGRVAMDNGSYAGVTQLLAAAENPPSLKAIMPAVPVADLFQSVPYFGGIFQRGHSLNWLHLISVDSWDELDVGFMDPERILESQEWLDRLSMRPVIDAANGFLSGDRLAQYKRYLENPTLGPYFQSMQNMPEDYSRIDVPVLLIYGSFDTTPGAIRVWNGLEHYAPDGQKRHMIIGPWTHGEAYFSGVTENNFYRFGEEALVDMWALRIAFLDRYVRGLEPTEELPDRVRVFITGANEWRSFDSIPVPIAQKTALFLSSNGNANTYRGDGLLEFASSQGKPARFEADPENPISDQSLGIGDAVRITQRSDKDHPGMLVYLSPPLDEALTVVGQPTLNLTVSVDTPDADIIAVLEQVYPDGTVVTLTREGALRLRYRDGFDREDLLVPHERYEVEFELGYMGHRLGAGSRLQLTLMGTSFPMNDPNPNTGEFIATAVQMQTATVTVHHDEDRPSVLVLPVVPPGE